MEDDDNIFGDDEILDYIIYEEIEKETGKEKNNAGCLNSIILTFAMLGSFASLIFWIFR